MTLLRPMSFPNRSDIYFGYQQGRVEPLTMLGTVAITCDKARFCQWIPI